MADAGFPTYSAPGVASTAAQAPYRAIAAELVARLADTGRYDLAATAEETGHLSAQRWLGPGRVTQTLSDCASVSPPAG